MIQTETSNPDADISVRRALAALRDNRLDEAEAHCRNALVMAKEHIGALTVLGGILHTLGRHGESEAVFETLTDLQPNEPAQWMNLGTARRGAGKFDAALAAYARAGELGGKTADFYFNLGLTHLDRLDYESARAVLARAMELAPDDAEIRFEYARTCNESNHTDEAVAALEGWRGLKGLAPALTAKIGQQLLSLGETQPAENVLSELVAVQNLEPRAALTLAQILERTNRLAAARGILDRLAANPRARSLGVDLTVTEAQLAQRESRHEDACRLLRQALGRCRDFHKRHFELFQLAKSLDALGQYEEAFETLEEAHRSQLAHFQLIAPLITARGAPALVITQHSCDAADIAAWDESTGPAVEESPIFVVGFPRSGTTLLELTLDAHPGLRSMDEQPFLQNAIDELMSRGVRYPSELALASDADLAAARSRYWDRVHRKLQLEPGQRLVDKNPLNLLRLPAIRRLFPKAHVLLAIRHPFDVLLSCYMQHFTAPDFALLCVNLPTLARAYRRSFDFWFEQAALLRPAVHEVSYESLVEDFDRQVRKIAEFLELPWNDAMLEPGRHAEAKGYISTPSYAQVVQPVNSKAVGRWRPYAAHFTALSPQLQPYFERWGYSAETSG